MRPRSRIIACLTLAAVIALGLASRSLDDWLPDFLVANTGDFLWTVAAYVSIAIVRPCWHPLRLGMLAFGISVGVELSQLVELDWLIELRQTLPGRLLLGSSFVGVDLLRYFAGACTATAGDWLWHCRLRRMIEDASCSKSRL